MPSILTVSGQVLGMTVIDNMTALFNCRSNNEGLISTKPFGLV